MTSVYSLYFFSVIAGTLLQEGIKEGMQIL